MTDRSIADDQADALTALWEAVDDGDALNAAMAIKRCTSAGVGVDDERKSDGVTPLAVAVKRGDVGVAKLLFKQGAKADRLLVDGATLLWMAGKEGSVPMVELLLAQGAQVNRVKRTTVSPLPPPRVRP